MVPEDDTGKPPHNAYDGVDMTPSERPPLLTSGMYDLIKDRAAKRPEWEAEEIHEWIGEAVERGAAVVENEVTLDMVYFVLSLERAPAAQRPESAT
jgi:hypothetical protein